jgi:hypothetical protein
MSFVQVPPDSTGKLIATNEIGGQQYQIVNLADDTGAALSPLTDAQLRATPVDVDTGLTQGLTDVQLRAAPVEISGAETDGAAPTGGALLVAGVTAGGTVQYMEVNASGHVNISDGGGSITIDNTHLAAIDAMQTTIGELTQAIADQNAMMMQMLNYLKSLGNVDSGYRQRVVVDSIAAGTITTVGTVTAVTAVTSVTNVAAIGGFGYQQFQAPSQTAYNTGTLPYLVST